MIIVVAVRTSSLRIASREAVRCLIVEHQRAAYHPFRMSTNPSQEEYLSNRKFAGLAHNWFGLFR